MVNEYSLVSLSEVKNFAGITGSVSKVDDLLEDLINRISLLFENYMDRTILTREYTEHKDGKGSNELFPDQCPITTISGIWDNYDWQWTDSSLIDSDNYRIVNSNRIMFKSTILSDCSANIKIIYTAGYTTVPEDLKQVAITEITRIYKNKNNVSVTTRFSKTEADGSVISASDDLLPQTMLVLNKYKRVVII